MRGAGLILLLCFGAAARAGDDEVRARELRQAWNGAPAFPDPASVAARQKLLLLMGELDAPTSRAVLLDVARRSRSLDERVAAAHALGAAADVATAEALFRHLERHAEPAVLVALSDGLAAARRGDLRAWLCGPGLRAGNEDLLRTVCAAVGRLRLPGATAPLIALYEKGGPDVAPDALRALAAIGAPEAREAVRSSAAHPLWQVRLAAAETLPRLRPLDDALLAHLRLLFADPSPTVRRLVAGAVADEKIEALVPELIAMLGDVRLRNRYDAQAALQKISSRDFGCDASTWRRWFRTRQEGGKPESISSARYYGGGVHSDRVLFVVDLSGSMARPEDARPARVDVARSELIRVLGELPKESRFNVLVFAEATRSWRPSEEEATPANVRLAVEWVNRHFRPSGGTNTHGALADAFARNPEFDTIYLLSDGQPTLGECTTPLAILADVRARNRDRHATVHTIALTLANVGRGARYDDEDPEAMRSFMQGLADATGGESREVTDPP